MVGVGLLQNKYFPVNGVISLVIQNGYYITARVYGGTRASVTERNVVGT